MRAVEYVATRGLVALGRRIVVTWLNDVELWDSIRKRRDITGTPKYVYGNSASYRRSAL
jgi:hypothetical protein